jgi:hypothetical protein
MTPYERKGLQMPALVNRRSPCTADDLWKPGAATPPHLRLADRAAAKQHILAVTFRSTDGRRWSAVGGGETVAAATEWARECCPGDTVWELESFSDLYGD